MTPVLLVRNVVTLGGKVHKLSPAETQDTSHVLIRDKELGEL